MSQDTALIRQYDPEFVRDFTVGATDILPHRLYKQDTDGTLIVCTDNYDGPIFLPCWAANAGEPVSAWPVGTFVMPLVASGSITKGDKLSPAASGAVRTATTGDVVIGRAPKAASTTELVTVDTVTSGTGAASNSLSDGNGGSAAFVVGTELLTLDTGGTTTDTTANLLPANSEILAVCAIVTTTITTATGWKLGDATTSGRFTANNTNLTAGSASKIVGLVHRQGGISTDAAGPVQTAAAKVRVTCAGSAPGAGAIRIVVYARSFAAPTA